MILLPTLYGVTIFRIIINTTIAYISDGIASGIAK